MKNKKLKDLLLGIQKTPSEELNFLNDDQMNQVGGDVGKDAGPKCGTNTCGYYGANAGECTVSNGCSWNA